MSTLAFPLTRAERAWLDGTRAPQADVFEERVLRIEHAGADRVELRLDGCAWRSLWPGAREEFRFESPGAAALAPFTAEDREHAHAELSRAAASAPRGRTVTRIERRLRVATRAGAWQRSEVTLHVERDPPHPTPPLAAPLHGVVLLRPRAAGALIHELIGHGCEAGVAGEPPALRPGRIVGPLALTVLDRPPAPIDDEGSPAEGLTLVGGGCVAATLADRRAGGAGGRGRRASFRDPPLPRMGRLHTAPGHHAERDLHRGAVAVVDEVVSGEARGDGMAARLIAASVACDGVRYGPVELRIGLEALLALELGDTAIEDGEARCGRDGQELPLTAATPVIRIEAELFPA